MVRVPCHSPSGERENGSTVNKIAQTQARLQSTVNDTDTTSQPVLRGGWTMPTGLDRIAAALWLDLPHRATAPSTPLVSVSRSGGPSARSKALSSVLAGWVCSANRWRVPSPKLSPPERGISGHPSRRVMGAYVGLPALSPVPNKRTSSPWDRGGNGCIWKLRIRWSTGKLRTYTACVI